MKAKLDIKKLEVKSFVTKFNDINEETVKGGFRPSFLVTCIEINTVCNTGDTAPAPGFPCF